MASISKVAVAATLLVVLWLSACGSLDTDTEPAAPALATPTRQPTTTATSPQAVALVLAIEVAERQSDIPDYARDDWKHWTDADDDCQNARQEVLIEESSAPVTFIDDRMCRVESGTWTDPYTGTIVQDASDLDIDHMVPLANAHDSGGHSWSGERKERFANHLPFEGHLVATIASANRAKGRKGPEEWRPPDRDYWCQYAVDWIAIKKEWGLTATQAEVDALREMLDTCDHASILQTTAAGAASEMTSSPTPTTQSQPAEMTSPTPTPSPSPTTTAAGAPSEMTPSPTPTGHSQPAEVTSPTPTLSPSPTASAEPASAFTDEASPSNLLYDPEGPDRNCSDFEHWDDAQRFYEAAGGPESDPHRLDRDRNGIACESLPGARDS